MSLIILSNPSTTPTTTAEWVKLLSREDVSNIGNGLSVRTFFLNNWDSGSSRPIIAQGSIVEVGGSIFQADSNTAIVDDPGGLSDGQIRIVLSPDSPTNPTLVTPYFVNDAFPSWDPEKGGWYDSDDKFLPFEMTRGSSGSTYTNKFEYDNPNLLIRRYASGAMYLPNNLDISGSFSSGSGASFGGAISSSGSISVGGGGTFSGNVSGISSLSCSSLTSTDVNATNVNGSSIASSGNVFIDYTGSASSHFISGAGVTQGSIFSALSPAMLSGRYYVASGGVFISSAYHIISTAINLGSYIQFYVAASTGVGVMQAVSGSATAWTTVSISIGPVIGS